MDNSHQPSASRRLRSWQPGAGAKELFLHPPTVEKFKTFVSEGLASIKEKIAGKSPEEASMIIKEELPEKLPTVVREASAKLAAAAGTNLDAIAKKQLEDFSKTKPQGDLKAIVNNALTTGSLPIITMPSLQANKLSRKPVWKLGMRM